MSSTLMDPTAPPAEPADPGMSILERAVAVFVRPSQAWSGLRHQRQFWFPMLILFLGVTVFTFVLWERAYLPDASLGWRQAVDNGQMTQEQVEKIETNMSGIVPKTVSAISYGLIFAVFTLIGALGTWFGVGFILGTRLSYRLALEVTSWSGLVQVPALIVTGILAWSHESVKAVHLGLAVLLPDPETPNKMLMAAKVFLDAIGPFAIWALVVSILGASALSGAPRKSVAWVCIALTLVFAAFGAAMAAMLGPGR
ncbi:MAG: YIP1 family protein [Candidatus Eisenbacteria bacterium]